jgi:hypothetical protein
MALYSLLSRQIALADGTPLMYQELKERLKLVPEIVV